MIEQDSHIVEIDGVTDLVTQVDHPDLPQGYALSYRNLRNEEESVIGKLDFGTVHRHATYPIRPNPFKVIVGAAAGTGNVIRLEVTGHGIAEDATVVIDEMTGTGAVLVNGIHEIHVVDANHIELDGSAFNGALAYVGGIVTATPITIIDMQPVFDPTTDTEYDFVVGLDTDGNTRLYVFDVSWLELTRKITALINEGAGIGAADKNFDIDGIQERGIATTLGVNQLINWICKNVTKGKVFLVTANTATNITALNVLGSNGLGFANDDVLEFYAQTGIFDGFQYNNGLTPHIRMQPEDSLKKVSFLYGTSAVLPVLRTPVVTQKRAANGYFFERDGVGGAYLALLPNWNSPSSGWHVDRGGGGLIPTFIQRGYPNDGFNPTTSDGPLRSAEGLVTDSINDSEGNLWLKIKARAKNRDGVSANGKCYITVLYDDGTKESDPIYQLFFGPDGGFTWAGVGLSFFVNFARMNKRISGLRIYTVYRDYTVTTFKDWTEKQEEYIAIQDIPFRSQNADIGVPVDVQFEWRLEDTEPDGCIHRFERWEDGPYVLKEIVLWNNVDPPILSYDQQFQDGSPSLLDTLGREVDRNREYFNPGHITKAARTQGAVVVINKDSRTNLISLYNGDNIHEEDNFADITSDARGFPQRIPLNGKGNVVGLTVMDDNVYTFRDHEIEWKDLQQGGEGSILEGVAAPRSIVAVGANGVAFVGPAGIRLLRRGGLGAIELLNPRWRNILDGSLLIDDGSVQVLTEANRSAIVGGYLPLYDALFYLIRINRDVILGGGTQDVLFIHSFKSTRWRQRVLNIPNAVRSFVYTRTKKLAIVTEKGILEYPHTGTYNFEDGVRISTDEVERSSGKALEPEIMLNIPAFSEKVSQSVLVGMIIDHIGKSTDRQGAYSVDLFANGDSEAFDTQYFDLDEPGDLRAVKEFGAIEKLLLKVSSLQAEKPERIDLSKISLVFKKIQRYGNI